MPKQLTRSCVEITVADVYKLEIDRTVTPIKWTALVQLKDAGGVVKERHTIEGEGLGGFGAQLATFVTGVVIPAAHTQLGFVDV